MRTFIAIYRGDTVAQAVLVGLSLDQELVAEVASKLLADGAPLSASDPIVSAKQRSERQVLRLVRAEARAGAQEDR